jgi:hypothetical protein
VGRALPGATVLSPRWGFDSSLHLLQPRLAGAAEGSALPPSPDSAPEGVALRGALIGTVMFERGVTWTRARCSERRADRAAGIAVSEPVPRQRRPSGASGMSVRRRARAVGGWRWARGKLASAPIIAVGRAVAAWRCEPVAAPLACGEPQLWPAAGRTERVLGFTAETPRGKIRSVSTCIQGQRIHQ